MYESLCVRGWVAKEGILSSASLTGIRLSRRSSLSALLRGLHRELCPRKPARPEEKDEESKSVGAESQFSKEWDSESVGWKVRTMTR